MGDPLRQYVARLENVPPSQLCYTAEGGGLKGKGCGTFAAHRDENAIGRIQCVLALSDVGFDVWPFSHELPAKSGDIDGSGHFHLSQAFVRDLKNHSERVVFSAKAGDVFIFVGGLTVHGVPDIGENQPSPRVVTYATFWPAGTAQGIRHAKKQCACSKAVKDPIG
jgi:hypothetical protein